jgi:hypothetical protein
MIVSRVLWMYSSIVSTPAFLELPHFSGRSIPLPRLVEWTLLSILGSISNENFEVVSSNRLSVPKIRVRKVVHREPLSCRTSPLFLDPPRLWLGTSSCWPTSPSLAPGVIVCVCEKKAINLLILKWILALTRIETHGPGRQSKNRTMWRYVPGNVWKPT